MKKTHLLPVSIPAAAAWLAQHNPEWAISAKQLRGMCERRDVRCIIKPRATSKRPNGYSVRIAHLLDDLDKLEQSALTSSHYSL